jgi:tRNA (mo5U34)-methyltransferase
LIPVYETLSPLWPRSAWCTSAAARADERLARHTHGDLPRWRAALDSLPSVETMALLDRDMPELGATVSDTAHLRDILMHLHPWRKGPLRLGGVAIDSEWRSDWKWRRVAPYVELEGQRVLDIGCGNGYFGLRMLAAGARLVLGVDPTLLFVMQWLACRHFSGDLSSFVLPLSVEELPDGRPGFDTVFSMGVLYHRRDPWEHLQLTRNLLRNDGMLVLETLVLPAGRERDLLQPRGRYARMPNVWAVPGTERLLDWLKTAGYREVEVVDVTATRTGEQRSTPWMRFESLEQALDPADRTRTVEGLPAPVRAVVIAHH